MDTIRRHLDYGYYFYREKIYLNKLDAMDHALANNDLNPDIRFCLNDDVYSRIDCTVEPELSLDEYYRQRAQQLRDEYDYIILMYSGGSDSHQVLMTFLKHHIFLDEVRTLYPVGLLKKMASTPDPSHPFGLLFEYEFAATPGLKMAKALSPKTKINVIDTAPVYDASYNENWLENVYADFRTSGGLYHAIRRMDESIALQQETDNTAKRVVVLYGAEKPYMRLEQNHLYFYFADFSRCGAQHINLYKDDLNFKPEMFYWSRQHPLIVVKQAHVIRNALETDKALAQEVRKADQVPPRVATKLLYPDWDYKYQKLVKHNDEIIPSTFFGDRVKSITDLKNNHLNDHYGKLGGVKLLTMAHSDRWFFTTESKRHYIGEVRPKWT